MGNYKGRITKIEKSEITSCMLTQGIKGDKQYHYDNSERYNGSNGSYTSNYNTEYGVDLYLTIYGNKQEDDKRVKIDIREAILDANELKRISSKKMQQIVDDNVGRKVSFDIVGGRIIFDEGELKL